MQIGSKKVVSDIFGNSWLMPTPALEEGAADLTRETNGMMKRGIRAAGQAAAGGPVDFDDGSDAEPNVTSDETHQMDGDNLSGGDDFSDDPDSVPGMDDGMGGEDDMGMGGGMDDGMGGGMDDGMGGENVDEMGNPIFKPEEARRIRKLQTNLSALSTSVGNTLKSLNEFAPTSTTPEIRKAYNGALDHLTEMKNILQDLLSTKFDNASYPEKLRRYIAVRHVYSLTVDQLINVFNALDIENGRDPDKDPEKGSINT